MKKLSNYLDNKKVTIDYEILDKLKKVFNREYTLGFLNNVNNNDDNMQCAVHKLLMQI